jgi:hypothetical protein
MASVAAAGAPGRAARALIDDLLGSGFAASPRTFQLEGDKFCAVDSLPGYG